MTFILALALLASIALLAAGLRALISHDGLGHRPLPRSHRDEQARELSAWLR